MRPVVPLRRLARFEYGEALAGDARQEGNVPVMSSGGETGAHNHANAPGPTIVVGRKGSHGSIWWSDQAPFVIDTAYFVVPNPVAADLRWLYYALQTMNLPAISSDVGVPGLSREAAYARLLPLVPLAEQRRIADFLDERVALIDQIIAARHGQRVLLGERLASCADAVSQARSGEPVSRLGRVARVQSGLTVDAARQANTEGQPRPYLRVANVQAGSLDLSEVKEVVVDPDLARRTTLRFGDVLMTEGGDLDKLGRGTVWRGEIPGCLHQNHVFAVRCGPALLPEFLATYSLTSAARAYFESTGVRSTNLASTSSAKVLSLPIPARAVSDQERAVSEFREVAEQVERASRATESSITLLQEYKRSLITAAVTGQFDVASASTGIPEEVSRG